jgi:PKD repeat protein
MSIPINDREELTVSSIGIENYPQNVITKNSLWVLQLGYNRFFFKEYNGYFNIIEDIILKKFLLTKALKSDFTFDNNKFWVWYTDLNDTLFLEEWEPYTDKLPERIILKNNIYNDVIGLSVYLKENDIIRIIILTKDLELKMLIYSDIRSSNPPIISDLNWSSSRLQEISNFINSNNTSLEISFLDVLSPPNIYLETYSIDIPLNFVILQIGQTNQILLEWDTVTDADYYIIERDISSTFDNNPVTFTSNINTYIDTLSEVGTYYYRIRAFNESWYIYSEWSSVENITFILNADFSADILICNIGTPITFTDFSTPFGTITLWRWDFGDGSPYSYEQNPVHIYNTPGIYTVTLYVESGSYNDTEIKTNYITIATALTADFEATPTTGDANLVVQFTDLSEGEPIYWEWDFGDGYTSNEQNPIHVYTKAGIYTVSLLVKDDTFTDIETKVNYITVNMVADFSASIVTGPADLVVFFTDLSLGEPFSWLWDFGDGYTSNEQNPTHIYTEAGKYTVTLTAFNDTNIDTEIKVNYITVYAVANFYGEPITGYSSLLVQFTDISTGNPNSWFWDFGDGSYSNEQNPKHFYERSGEYTVSLSITTSFNNNTITKIKYIKVFGISTPDIAPEPDIKAYLKGNASSIDLDKGIEIKFNI